MTCPGAHCPGCRDHPGRLLAALAGGAAVLAAAVVIARAFWWLAAAVGGSAVLSVGAAIALARAASRRDGWHETAPQEPQVITATVIPPVTASTSAAVENHYHLHFDGADATRAAAIIRQAIPGTAGDATTKEEPMPRNNDDIELCKSSDCPATEYLGADHSPGVGWTGDNGDSADCNGGK